MMAGCVSLKLDFFGFWCEKDRAEVWTAFHLPPPLRTLPFFVFVLLWVSNFFTFLLFWVSFFSAFLSFLKVFLMYFFYYVWLCMSQAAFFRFLARSPGGGWGRLGVVWGAGEERGWSAFQPLFGFIFFKFLLFLGSVFLGFFVLVWRFFITFLMHFFYYGCLGNSNWLVSGFDGWGRGRWTGVSNLLFWVSLF